MGVSLHFRDEPSAASTAKRMRCHLAFAREAGFAQVAQCPLYFAGVTMEQKTPLSLDIMGENHGIAVEIQRQTREAFAPVKSAAERP